MSERLRSYPISNDTGAVRPSSTSRLMVRTPDGAESHGHHGNFGITVDLLLSRINALPVLTPTAVRALQLADREMASAREIVALIETDVRFGPRVVKAANAPSNHLPRPVASVNDAILLLGTTAVRDALVVAASRDIFFRPLEGYGLTAEEVWAHAVACATASEIVADLIGYSNRMEAFVAGLLHDVGKIILNDEMILATDQVREHIVRENCTYIDAERAVLGFDHCDVGARAGRTWAVPQHIVQAIALHRAPVVLGQTVPLAGLVHLGEMLCSMAGIGIGFEGLNMTLDTRVLRDFKFTEEMGDIAIGRLIDKMAASNALQTPPAEPAAMS